MTELLGMVFTGIFSGGATGLLGIIIQRFFDAKKVTADIALVKLQMDGAQSMRKMELEAQERMADRAAETQALMAQLDANAREVEAEERSYQASHGSDKATYSAPSAQGQSRAVRLMLGFVDFVRGLVRPGITTYTLALLTAVFVWVQTLYSQMGLAMTADQAHDLAMQCVQTIFYLATTTVVWWFGARPAQSPSGRKR